MVDENKYLCFYMVKMQMGFSKRKYLKWAGSAGWFLLGFLVGIGVIVLWYCFKTTNIKEQSEYDFWQLSYYLFQIIGAIGTLLAVIVALAKEAIMKWLYSPDLKVSLVGNGITEVISNDNQRVPEADSFECYVTIENTGSLAALGCKAYISDIRYGKSRSNLKTIRPLKKWQMRWMSPEVDMPVGIPNKVKLFGIINPNSVGTPQSGTDNQKSQITFNGCELKSSQSEKGLWEIDYFITCKNGDVSKFAISIEWNGEFKSRVSDMMDVLIVQIVEK